MPACVTQLVADRNYSRPREELAKLREKFNANHGDFLEGELNETVFLLRKAMKENNNKFLLKIGKKPRYEEG